MGIKAPQEKFKIPDRINGIATQSAAGGRAEGMVRRTPLPVTYVDFHAQFPAVSKLLNCREILCAESLEFPDFTAEAEEMLERTTKQPNDPSRRLVHGRRRQLNGVPLLFVCFDQVQTSMKFLPAGFVHGWRDDAFDRRALLTANHDAHPQYGELQCIGHTAEL